MRFGVRYWFVLVSTNSTPIQATAAKIEDAVYSAYNA